LITDDGTALISDFGIARALGDATLTSSGMIHGTPAYLAPEVARGGEADFASDVFSLGSTLYSALEGRPPFGMDDNTMALLHRVASGQFAPPQHSDVLTPVILQMLSTDPDARPKMSAVTEHLAQLAVGSPLETTVVAPVPAADEPQVVESDPRQLQTNPSAAPAVESQWASAIHDQPPSQPAPRRGLAAAVAVVALIGIGILVTALLMNDRRVADPSADSSPASSAAPASTSLATSSTSSAPSATPSAASPTSEASAPQQGPEPKATARTKTRSQTEAPTTAPTVRGTPTAAELRRAITSYYALMPRNTDAAWPRMTSSYQTNHAGGREAYQRFWDAIRKVTVADVRGTPPNSARATLTYYFKDGRVVRERTAYGLVREDGILKINSSTVLSSVTLQA
jgi:serine/threonine protein kinase